jgi:hypothetical protein
MLTNSKIGTKTIEQYLKDKKNGKASKPKSKKGEAKSESKADK